MITGSGAGISPPPLRRTPNPSPTMQRPPSRAVSTTSASGRRPSSDSVSSGGSRVGRDGGGVGGRPRSRQYESEREESLTPVAQPRTPFFGQGQGQGQTAHASSPVRVPSNASAYRRSPLGVDREGLESRYAGRGSGQAYGGQTQIQGHGNSGYGTEAPLSQHSFHHPDFHRHRPRQHSQGFFEPTLPSASTPSTPAAATAPLPSNAPPTTTGDHHAPPDHRSASQIAAQTAMQHIPSPAAPPNQYGPGHPGYVPHSGYHSYGGHGQRGQRPQPLDIPAATATRRFDTQPATPSAGTTSATSAHGYGFGITPFSPASGSATGAGTNTSAGGQGAGGVGYQYGVAGGRTLAATTAANLVFPRRPSSPMIAQTPQQQTAQTQPATTTAAAAAALPSGAVTGRASPSAASVGSESTPQKSKGERSKMKLFSKPKHITISRDKDGKAFPSPGRTALANAASSGLSRIVNASAPSVHESGLYSLGNSSATTVVPVPEGRASSDAGKEIGKEKEKDKPHKHHFLTRPKLKLKDKDDAFAASLSSASSNSRPLDPNAPQSLYNFASSSPPGGAFGKSVSALDLRPAARAKRERRREEKAAAGQDFVRRDSESTDWGVPVGGAEAGVGAGGAGTGTMPAVAAVPGIGSTVGVTPLGTSGTGLYGAELSIREALSGFGMSLGADDAWDFLKAKLLVVFEGADVPFPLEDLNKLVAVHVQRCVARGAPDVLVEDVRDLAETGFRSLDQHLRALPDELLVPHLARLWRFVFGAVLPFLQAVFFPLDLEFKGRGPVMSAREAREFWGAADYGYGYGGRTGAGNSRPGGMSPISVGDELDVRNIVLLAFRDVVILSRYERLKQLFSRLSLDRIDLAGLFSVGSGSGGGGDRGSTSSSRPATSSTSTGADAPISGSYTSSSSAATAATAAAAALLTGSSLPSASDASGASRSRAGSNPSQTPAQVQAQADIQFQPRYPFPYPPYASYSHAPGSLLSQGLAAVARDGDRSGASRPGSRSADAGTGAGDGQDHPGYYGYDAAAHSLHAHAPSAAVADASLVATETMARMLQCVSVLAGAGIATATAASGVSGEWEREREREREREKEREREDGIGIGGEDTDADSIGNASASTNGGANGGVSNNNNSGNFVDSSTSTIAATAVTDPADAQARVLTLSRTLKHNWLGRARTGRDRRGFVGTKLSTGPGSGAGAGIGTGLAMGSERRRAGAEWA